MGSRGSITAGCFCVAIFLLAVVFSPVRSSEPMPEVHTSAMNNGTDNECGINFNNEVRVRPPCVSHEEGEFESEVYIARLEFGRLQTIFIVAMFIIIVVIAKMVWHHKWMHPVSSNIPESCMLIIVGAHVGGILIATFYLDECNRDQPSPLRFTPDIFFLALLPPIVLESGYFLDNRAFFENFTTICVFAVIGTLWNTVAIGMTLYGLFNAGVLLTESSVAGSLFTPSAALLFGTICSAVDPVAVLAVFDDIHVNRLLHILVFGESLLNDAVTIVLFKVLGAFANRPFDTAIMNEEDRNINIIDVSFSVHNVSEMIIFLFLGLSLYETGTQNWDWGLSLWTLLFALLYRPIGIVVLTLVLNLFRTNKMGFKSVFVMSFSGLRGAVAFSLALARISAEPALENPTNCELYSEAQLRKTMLTAVTFLVLFTVFVQGITIKPLVRLIKVRTASLQKPTMNEVIHGTTIDHVMSGLEDILGHYGHNRVREKIVEIDSKYLRKFFERYPEARNEQILHTFKRLQYQESHKAVEQNLVFEYHKDDEGQYGSHISLHDEHAFTPAGTPRPYTDPETMPEECIPSLNDILAASFANPHEDHFGHVLATTDREIEDHHFEPVNVRRDIIRAKHRQRRNRHRGRKRFSQLMKASSERTISDVGQESTDGDRTTIPLEELEEEVPPIPTDFQYLEHEQEHSSTFQILPSIETDV